jgi:putative flippase GtrA
VTLTWRLNRALTFAASGPPSWREFGHYLAISLVALLVNYGLYSVALFLRAPVLIALVIGTAGGAAFNFIRYREIFTVRETPEGGS